MDTVYAWMRNLIFYYIFLSAVMNFLPDNSYKKYIRFFMGVLLIVLLMTPIFQAFQMKDQLGSYLQKRNLEEAFCESKWNMVYAGESQRYYLNEAYEREVEKNIQDYLEEKELEVQSVTVAIGQNDQVVVEQIEIVLAKEPQRMGIIKEIKNQLMEVYNISGTNINISTQG